MRTSGEKIWAWACLVGVVAAACAPTEFVNPLKADGGGASGPINSVSCRERCVGGAGGEGTGAEGSGESSTGASAGASSGSSTASSGGGSGWNSASSGGCSGEAGAGGEAGGAEGTSGEGGGGGTGGTAGPGGAGGGGAGSGAGGAGGGSGGGASSCLLNWNGDFQIGTASDDELLGLSMDLEGSVYYTGYEHGNVHITNITPAGNATMVVRKLDKSGALVWDKALDTPGTDTGESLVVDPSGDKLYVVGRTSGAFPGFSNQGQFDIVVAMMNSSSGAVVDLVQNGSERPQHPRQIAMNGQNELVVGGFDDTYVPNVAVIDWENSLLAKYSICEQKTLTPSLYLQSNSIYTDFLTGIVADGSSLYASGAIGAGPDEGGTFVQQFDANGAPGWKYVFSTISVDYTTAIALSPDGDLYATGASFLTLGDESFGQQDMFLAKFDKMTGSLVWMAQAGTSESDWPTAIGFDFAGNVYVAGSTLGSFPGYQNQGEDDLFMLTFDSTGALTSTWQKGSPAWDNLSGMVVDACGNVLLGGFTAGSLLPGASHLGGRDMFLLKVE